MKVTNDTKAPQGIQTDTGLIYVLPGETQDLQVTEAGQKLAKRVPGLTLSAAEKAKIDDKK